MKTKKSRSSILDVALESAEKNLDASRWGRVGFGSKVIVLFGGAWIMGERSTRVVMGAGLVVLKSNDNEEWRRKGVMTLLGLGCSGYGSGAKEWESMAFSDGHPVANVGERLWVCGCGSCDEVLQRVEMTVERL
ncbi:unnamed protein product [Dovyalis caffra]|uniref:Uncharacterized protein n=1 Tax=Dovyalis caffra TaxID=77055 RepID=A0AAV1RPJ0_9ROSI|nr:unnamed protein product [Dovyalis caffra]